jgi:hypothetical protein
MFKKKKYYENVIFSIKKYITTKIESEKKKKIKIDFCKNDKKTDNPKK